MKKVSLLVIDDDGSFLAQFSDVIRQSQWDVDVAGRPEKAIALAKEKIYDLVLIDANMVGIEPALMIEQVRSVKPDVLAFLVTSGSLKRLMPIIHEIIPVITKRPTNTIGIVNMLLTVRHSGSVLVVSDDVNDRRLLHEQLTQNGYHVYVAGSGREAILLATEHDIQITVIDMAISDMSGAEAMKKLKDIRSSMFFVAITGYELCNMVDGVVAQGIHMCFLKPFDVGMLLKELGDCLHRGTTVPDFASQGAKPRILLVDDDEHVCETMSEILRESNYIVETVHTIEKAIELITRHTYNIVVSDFQMGDRNGLELVDPVRKRNASTGFILMTGQGTMEIALESMKKGVNEYLLKPFQPAELIHKVEAYLETQQLQMEREMLMKEVMAFNEKLMEVTRTDELTQVFNRRYLFEVLHGEIQRARRQKTNLTLFMCDVDGFKKYNDTYGHVEGDKMLKGICDILKSTVRQYLDQVFRYGGDEFAIVLPGVDALIAQDVAGRILHNIKEVVGPYNVGLSIGAACYNGNQPEIANTAFVDIADKKLYTGKKSGKGRFMI